MRSTILAAAVFASSALAFKGTSPLLIWSSEADDALSGAQAEIASGVFPAEDIYNTLSTLGCGWETLVVAHQEGLHNSRVSSLRLPSSSADLHVPYLRRPSKDLLDGAVDQWAKICGAEVKSSTGELEQGKNVLNVDLAQGQDTSSILADIASPYILIVTGSHASAAKREELPLQSSSQLVKPSNPVNDNTTVQGPLLDRVQILTTPLITGLLVVFLLLLPILYVGISALVGIQVPPRMLEIGKSMQVGKDRKDQ